MQALVAAISDPPTSVPIEYRGGAGRANVSNVMLSLQHDVGKWCSEYTWSADDEMWGWRVLHNFGRLGKNASSDAVHVKGVDEEEALGPGLRGRFSAGAEVYFSAKEKSAGGVFLMELTGCLY